MDEGWAGTMALEKSTNCALVNESLQFAICETIHQSLWPVLFVSQLVCKVAQVSQGITLRIQWLSTNKRKRNIDRYIITCERHHQKEVSNKYSTFWLTQIEPTWFLSCKKTSFILLLRLTSHHYIYSAAVYLNYNARENSCSSERECTVIHVCA